MNLVERWFGHLDSKAIRRGVFLSVADLQAAIEAFLQAWNQNPQPFLWTATIESIQEKLTRCRPNFGADPARLHQPQIQKAEAMTA